jgi:Protein of unknown function (DUF3618)
MRDVERLEREVSESRARLGRTVGRIRRRLSVSGIVDEVLGAVRRELGPLPGRAVDIARRNPAPLFLVAAGLGWMLYRLARNGRRPQVLHAEMLEEESIPVLNTGQARIYDPDVSPLHPTQDLAESRREFGVRA